MGLKNGVRSFLQFNDVFGMPGKQLKTTVKPLKEQQNLSREARKNKRIYNE